MFNTFLVRYDEIGTKGRNRGWFEEILQKNIADSIGNLGKVSRFRGRIEVEVAGTGDLEEIGRRLRFIPGISSFSPSVRLPWDAEWDDIGKNAVVLADKALGEGKNIFRVSCTRSDKRYPGSSIDISKRLAAYVLIARDKQFSVSMKQFQFNLEIEIDSNGIYLFSERIDGIHGMPVGCAGEVLTLLSGGIDSPVASFLTMRRGARVNFLSFHTPPYTGEESMRKLRDIAALLHTYQGGRVRLFIAPFLDIQLLIRARCYESYRTVLFRRMMFRIAERIAKKEGFKALVTGESLSQVASQTLENLTIINAAVESLPVIRPLITNEKQETITLARKIGSFDISVRPCADSCTAFLPAAPVIRGKEEIAAREEAKLMPEIEILLEKAVAEAEIFYVS